MNIFYNGTEVTTEVITVSEDFRKKLPFTVQYNNPNKALEVVTSHYAVRHNGENFYRLNGRVNVNLPDEFCAIFSEETNDGIEYKKVILKFKDTYKNSSGTIYFQPTSLSRVIDITEVGVANTFDIRYMMSVVPEIRYYSNSQDSKRDSWYSDVVQESIGNVSNNFLQSRFSVQSTEKNINKFIRINRVEFSCYATDEDTPYYTFYLIQNGMQKEAVLDKSVDTIDFWEDLEPKFEDVFQVRYYPDYLSVIPSSDWFDVEEVEKTVNQNNEIVKLYKVKVKENFGQKRSGTIKLQLRNYYYNNILKEDYIVINQDGGFNGTVTYKENIYPTWQDVTIEKDIDELNFEIYDYNTRELLFEGKSTRRPNNTNSFYINRIVSDYVIMNNLFTTTQSLNRVEHNEAYKEFLITYPNNTQTFENEIYKFRWDWSYKEDNNIQRTSPIINKYYQNQKLPFTVFNPTDVNKSVHTLQVPSKSYVTMNIINMSSIINSLKLHRCVGTKVLYYLSSNGGWNWLPLTNKCEVSRDFTSRELSKDYKNTTLNFGTDRYFNEVLTRYTVHTEYLNDEQSKRMNEVFESTKVYLHDLTTDEIIPVLINTNSVDIKLKSRNERLISYAIDLITSQTQRKL